MIELGVLVSVFALVWRIYSFYSARKKPRLRVSVHIVQIKSGRLVWPLSIDSEYTSADPIYVGIEVINYGPGRIKIAMTEGKAGPWWHRKKKNLMIPELSMGELPHWLDEGSKVDLLVPYNKDCVLGRKHLFHLGVRDGYGRYHWAPNKQLRIAKKFYSRDF